MSKSYREYIIKLLKCLDEIEKISKGCAEDNGVISQQEGYFIILEKIKKVKGK